MRAWLTSLVVITAAWGGDVTAIRLRENPLITQQMSRSLGDNINGPSVIRVPKWVARPMGRYYMYFAHHTGGFIRLAYSNSIRGPWKIYEPGVLRVEGTAFYRPQPDTPHHPPAFYTHVASPEIHIDTEGRRIVMWFHGWWTEGQRWPAAANEAAAFSTQHGYGQFTQVAESTDGLHFQVLSPITRQSYLRVFPYGGFFYGMARLGQLMRTNDPLDAFEPGPMPFRDGPYDKRVRHVATLLHGGRLYVFFSAIGDAPERIMVTTMDLRGDWKQWKVSDAAEVLTPQTQYECPGLPNVPSEPGEIEGPARQLRDPAVFEENGKTYLFYSFCGEQGLGAAELKFK
jgi:hypothetical protein